MATVLRAPLFSPLPKIRIPPEETPRNLLLTVLAVVAAAGTPVAKFFDETKPIRQTRPAEFYPQNLLLSTLSLTLYCPADGEWPRGGKLAPRIPEFEFPNLLLNTLGAPAAATPFSGGLWDIGRRVERRQADDWSTNRLVDLFTLPPPTVLPFSNLDWPARPQRQWNAGFTTGFSQLMPPAAPQAPYEAAPPERTIKPDASTEVWVLDRQAGQEATVFSKIYTL